jgi:putative oxidoreductase
MDIGATALRGIIGTLFVGHGTQKLFGWFDGHGPDGTGGYFESLGLRPGKRHALAAGAAETAGGALLAAGAFTPLAAAALNGTMVTAMRTAHKGKGPWVTGGGWEFNLVLIAATTALADSGPGRFSVDNARFPWMRGPLAAAFAVGAGVAGSYLAMNSPLNAAAEPEAEAEAPMEDATREATGRFAASGSPIETEAGADVEASAPTA